MSEKCKTILRPKVRFSQDSTDSSDSTKPFQRPKLISSITLGKPIKVIHGVSEQDLRKIRENNVLGNAKNTRQLHAVTSAPTSTNVEKNLPKQPPISASVPALRQATAGKSSVTTKASTKVAPARQACSRGHLKSNKENITQPSKKDPVPKQAEGKNDEKPKSQPSVWPRPTLQPIPPVASSQPKKSAVPPRKQPGNLPPAVKLVPTRVQNCRKPAPAPRRKAEVKTEVVRNVSGPKPTVYVGRGMPRGPLKVSSVPDVLPSSSSDKKLARPEYNSIVHTIKTLQKAQKQRVINDVEHLPSKYKNLVMRKVSSALDFPAGQAIYHDLINLSVDETQLPQPVTRSKDPQPRERDIEPILSDFFVPQYDEEYAQAVKIRPLTPEIHEDWDPFEISNKIFEWKLRLDED